MLSVGTYLTDKGLESPRLISVDKKAGRPKNYRQGSNIRADQLLEFWTGRRFDVM